MKYLSILMILLLMGCEVKDPEPTLAELRFDDAYALPHRQVLLYFKDSPSFNLGRALQEYMQEHKGRRRVVSVSVRMGRGVAMDGYWVLVEEVE